MTATADEVVNPHELRAYAMILAKGAGDEAGYARLRAMSEDDVDALFDDHDPTGGLTEELSEAVEEAAGRVLLEAGFTGVRTDSLGRKTNWADGKRVAKAKPEPAAKKEKAPKPEKPAPAPKAAKPDPAAVHDELKALHAKPGGATPEEVAGVTAKLKTLTEAQLKAIQAARGIAGGSDKAKRVEKIMADAKAKLAQGGGASGFAPPAAPSADVGDVYDRAGSDAKHSEVNAAMRTAAAMSKAEAAKAVTAAGYTPAADPRKQLVELIADRKGSQLRGLSAGDVPRAEAETRAAKYKAAYADEPLASPAEILAGKPAAKAAPAPKAAPVKRHVAAVQKVADAATDPAAKDWIASAIHNHDGTPADLAASLGGSIEGASVDPGSGAATGREIPPGAVEGVTKALAALGAKPDGPAAGKGTAYSAKTHQPVAGLFPGDPAVVVRPPLVLGGKVVSRGVVAKPGAKAAAAPAGPKAAAPAGHQVAGEYDGGAVVARDPKTGDLTTHFAPGEPEKQAAKLGGAVGEAMDELKMFPDFEDGVIPLGHIASQVKARVPGATDSDVMAALSHMRGTRQLEGHGLNERQKLTTDSKLGALGDGKSLETATLWDKDKAIHFFMLPKGKTGASLAPAEGANPEPAKAAPAAPASPPPAAEPAAPATPSAPHAQARALLDALGIDHGGHSDAEVVAKVKAAFAPAEPAKGKAAKPKKGKK